VVCVLYNGMTTTKLLNLYCSKALAQKLSIRLGRHFTQSKLVEISSQSLHSRWFGQSGRLVSKMFDEIRSLAEDEETLVCVLIDEVESITGSRENAQGSECNDALRVWQVSRCDRTILIT
jgi:SpoVK/Ycf46/Vps4 family AAA+-type ATPase